MAFRDLTCIPLHCFYGIFGVRGIHEFSSDVRSVLRHLSFTSLGLFLIGSQFLGILNCFLCLRSLIVIIFKLVVFYFCFSDGIILSLCTSCVLDLFNKTFFTNKKTNYKQNDER